MAEIGEIGDCMSVVVKLRATTRIIAWYVSNVLDSEIVGERERGEREGE